MENDHVRYWMEVEYGVPCAEQGLVGFNPCGEQISNGQNINIGGAMMGWVKSDEDANVCVEKVESFNFDLDPISEELAEADIFEVTLYVQLGSGSEHSITDLEEIMKFSRAVISNIACEDPPGTLGYYAGNARKYKFMCKEATKLNNG